MSALFANAVWRKSSRSNANGDCVEVAVAPSSAVWRKSTRSNANGNCVEIAGWHKSSRSNTNGNCVEVGYSHVAIGVRDSKNPTGGHLAVNATAWTSFLTTLKSGRYDL